jgi:hypothetical protein
MGTIIRAVAKCPPLAGTLLLLAAAQTIGAFEFSEVQA